MGMLITRLKRMIPTSYYDDGYKQILRDHLQELINDPETRMVEIDPDVGENATGDLTSILRHYRLDVRLHWPICIMNGLDSPMSYTSDITHLLVPSKDTIVRLHTYYKALHTI